MDCEKHFVFFDLVMEKIVKNRKLYPVENHTVLMFSFFENFSFLEKNLLHVFQKKIISHVHTCKM